MSWQHRVHRATIAAIAAATLLGPARATAQPPENEVIETYLHAKILDLAMLAIFDGVDPTHPLEFARTIDLDARAFAYAALPGQSYLGLPLALASQGRYEAARERYEWSTTASLGARGWTLTGFLAWASAPFTALEDAPPKDDGAFEAEAEGTDGTKYTVKGKATKAANGLSSTEGTVTSKASGGTSKFTGDDKWDPKEKKWKQSLTVEKFKNVPGPAIKDFYTAMIESGCGDALACGGGPTIGVANGTADFLAAPEPAPLALMTSGVLLLVGTCLRRARAA